MDVLWEDASLFHDDAPLDRLPVKKTTGQYIKQADDFILLADTMTYTLGVRTKKFPRSSSVRHKFFLIPLGMIRKIIHER